MLVVHGDATIEVVAGELWHSDVSCDAEPPVGRMLGIEQVPTSRGNTLFARMEAAYEALSDRHVSIDVRAAMHASVMVSAAPSPSIAGASPAMPSPPAAT